MNYLATLFIKFTITPESEGGAGREGLKNERKQSPTDKGRTCAPITKRRGGGVTDRIRAK